MQLGDRTVALYGRFSPGVRDTLAGRVAGAGGLVARDLTRRTDVLVVGALATALIDSEALPLRLTAARERQLPVFGERSFAAALNGDAPVAATLPLATALAQTGLSRADAAVLAAFDLIAVQGEACRFGDAAVIRAVAELIGQGGTLGAAVGILGRARAVAPLGRHKVILTAAGEPALQWDDGRTTLEGQGVLPLDEDRASLDDLFEAAALAEADGDFDAAARLYDLCARADRADPIAPYNLGNLRLAQGAYDQAILGYQRALARDSRFAEARYNLAQALEATGKTAAAATELGRVLAADPDHADAVFNLAQLRLAAGDDAGAKALYERYLALGPPDAWAATARKAIAYCAARLSA